MQVKFIIPKFGCHEKPAGVYKIMFDNNHFYIGSSSNLKARFRLWRYKIQCGTNKNKRIKELAQSVGKIEFIVLEVIPKEKCKEREGHYIKTNWEDPLLLNYCPNPENNYGIRFTEKDLLLRKKPAIKEKLRPVAVFDKDGQEVSRFKYISEVATFLKVKRDSVLNFLLGNTNYIKSHRLKEINKDGSFKVPPVYILKPRKARNRGYKHSEQARANKKRLYHEALNKGEIQLPIHSKKVVQLDSNGLIIKQYNSIGEAAKSVGGNSKKQLQKLLNGRSGNKTYKKYQWRYA